MGITLNQAVSKSQAAFLLTCQRGLAHGELYFWTFTFPKCCRSDAGANEAWRRFQRRWQEIEPHDFCGVRVAEVHPNGHGVHYHALCNKRVSIQIISRLAASFGFGRVSVTRADSGAFGYLAKYLSKGGDKLQKGCRRWSSFGVMAKVRVRDVEVDSKFHRTMRALQHLHCVKQLPITVVNRIYNATLLGEDRKETFRQGGGTLGDKRTAEPQFRPQARIYEKDGKRWVRQFKQGEYDPEIGCAVSTMVFKELPCYVGPG